jgi:hypothetical protein
MQNAEWISLFRQLPQEVHHKLILVAQNKMEISVEAIFRLEASYMAVRGRMGGTTEGGLLFVVPYNQLVTAYLNREVAEEDVLGLLGPSMNRLNVPSQQGARLNGSAPKPETEPSQPVAPAVAARNNLLERLRAARNAAQLTHPTATK